MRAAFWSIHLQSEFLSCTLSFIKKDVELSEFPIILALFIIWNILDDIQGLVEIRPVNELGWRRTHTLLNCRQFYHPNESWGEGHSRNSLDMGYNVRKEKNFIPEGIRSRYCYPMREIKEVSTFSLSMNENFLLSKSNVLYQGLRADLPQ